MEIIAHIKTDFPEKFGIPRQSGLVKQLKGKVIFEPKYRSPQALKGLEGYSHIWIIWQFSKAQRTGWSATVKPPRLGGKTHMGVFATRSPFRPNPIGLSAVRLERVVYDEKLGPILEVSGIDMLDGTPVYDIKPYLPYADSYPDAVGGFADQVKAHTLTVDFPGELRQKVAETDCEALIGLLSQDPRTAYIEDEERIWGITYKGYNIKFQVHLDKLKVTDVIGETID